MTGKYSPDFERYLTTLYCQEPDRVPLGDWSVDQILMEQFMGKPVVTLQDQVDFRLNAGFDFIPGLSGIFELFGAVGGIATKGEAAKTSTGEERTRHWANEHEGAITNWEQFEKYSWPSADDFNMSAWETFDEILPQGMKAILMLGKIYTPVWMLMGAESFFNALEVNEPLVEAMFEKVGQIQYETFLRVIEHPCVGAVANPDDIAHNTGLLINPDYLRKYLFPWYKKMGDVSRDKGIGFIFHSDGDCSEIMDDLIDAGFHGFNPIQPNCMDIVEVKKKWGQKLCLIGNINLDSTLTLGSPEDVRAEVYERIRTTGPGGGYMVASSNSITDYVPLENMRAMFDAIFEFGKYPIELKEGGVKGKIWTFQGKPKTGKEAPLPDLDVESYVATLLGNKTAQVIELVQKDIDLGMDVSDVVSKGMVAAMTVIGEKFQGGEIYIPEMMVAAKTMSETLSHFKDQLEATSGKSRGNIIIATVKGDLHDIGKNLVTMMLEGQGFSVEDLGVSVNTDKFVRAVQDKKPEILAMSALLTTTMVEMKHTIDALKNAGIRDGIKIIVGGAPLTQAFADEIGADGYAYDAPGAAKMCDELLSG